MKNNRTVAVLAMALVAALGCSKSESMVNEASRNHEPDPATLAIASGGKADLAAAQAFFGERCAACHGAEGKGNGPASAAINPRPRNYTDKAWQATVTDEQLRKTIRLGGAAVGKSPMMPASPDLEEKPDVVEGLVRLVRKFGT